MDDWEDMEWSETEKTVLAKIEAFNKQWENAQFYTPAHCILADSNIDKIYCVGALEDLAKGEGITWAVVDKWGWTEEEGVTQEEVDALIVLLNEIIAIWDSEEAA